MIIDLLFWEQYLVLMLKFNEKFSLIKSAIRIKCNENILDFIFCLFFYTIFNAVNNLQTYCGYYKKITFHLLFFHFPFLYHLKIGELCTKASILIFRTWTFGRVCNFLIKVCLYAMGVDEVINTYISMDGLCIAVDSIAHACLTFNTDEPDVSTKNTWGSSKQMWLANKKLQIRKKFQNVKTKYANNLAIQPVYYHKINKNEILLTQICREKIWFILYK